MIAGEARDIEGVKVKTAQPKRAKQLPTLPIPNSANTPKPTQTQQDFKPIHVRRQSFWVQRLRNLGEYLAHLVGCIMRRVCCDASGAFRASFV